MPLEGQMQGIGDSGWAEDFDQAWANRMIRDYGVSMEDLRDPGTRTWLNRQQRQKQQAALVQPGVKPGTGGAEPRPATLPAQPGQYGGVNPIFSQPGGARPGPQPGEQTGGPEPRPIPGSVPGGTPPGQRPRHTGNIFQDNRQRTATSAFTLSTNQR